MRKPKRRRTPAHKPTAKQREKAVGALSKIVADPTLPAYVVAKAAQAILTEGARIDAADPEPDTDAPIFYIVLPWNRRPLLVDGVQTLPRFGLYSEEQRVIQVPPGYPLAIEAEEHYAPYVSNWEAESAAKQRPALPAPNQWGAPFNESDPEIAEMKRVCDSLGLPPAPEAA